MLNTLGWIFGACIASYFAVEVFKGILRETLNAAVDRAINQAVRRLTSTDDEREYEATRQIVCDGIRRAIKAERDSGADVFFAGPR